MPAAPRINAKAEKIAFKIMGVPANMRPDAKKKQKRKVDHRLLFEETFRAR